MKIERAESKFEPVVITLESQEELEWLLACLNCSANSAKEQAKNFGLTLDLKNIIDDKKIDLKMFGAVRELWQNL